MYVAKVYNTRKKENFFRSYITGISRMLLLISARMLNVCSAHFLSRIIPLGRLDFCSTSIAEAGNSDDFVFLFENEIAVSVCTILCEEDKHTA